MTAWFPDGREIVFNQRAAGSQPPWKYNAGRVDTNHFNRDFEPGQARGGSHLAAIDPATGKIRPVTKPVDGRWDFRGEWSHDGSRLLFCRAAAGENPAIWIVNRDGSAERRLTDGADGRGADHPRWLRA